MTDALSIAVSGLMAQGMRLAAAANNITNAATVGALPTAAAPVSTVYRPLSVSYAALTGGGVAATVTENKEGFSAVFDPSNFYANNEGLIAAPNVNLVSESVNILESKILFRADIALIKSQKDMMDELLDIVR
jgi:flagellar basal-body rod protein FlgC